VPIGYSSANTYPLVLWLHGGEGNDNVKQITHGNVKGTHLRISSEVPSKLPALVLAPQCPVGENWSASELNQPTNAWQLAREILASAEKQFAIDPDRCCGPIDGWIGCVATAANASGKLGGRGGSGGLR
jgi:predicted peptidase